MKEDNLLQGKENLRLEKDFLLLKKDENLRLEKDFLFLIRDNLKLKKESTY